MNSRNRKKEKAKRKIEYGKRKALHKLFDLALDINGLEDRKKGLTGNLPTAFFYYAGHVSMAEINVYRYGWDPHQGADQNIVIYDCKDIGKKVKQLEALAHDFRSDSMLKNCYQEV